MLLKKWWFLLRYFCFWMALFAFYRLLFLLQYFFKLEGDSYISILSSFYHALYLDASAACYILVIPTLLLGLAYLFQNHRFIRAINVYTVFFIFLYGFIAIGEVGIYREWGTKLNYQALTHFMHFGEVIKTISYSLLITFFTSTAIIGGLFTWWYWRALRLEEVYTQLKYPLVRYLLGILVLFVNCLAVFTGIRGGWYPIPISQSVSYYSKDPVLNDAAVNSGWNLFSNISENYFNLDKSPFEVMPTKEALAIVRSLYKTNQDSTIEILNTTRPNLCFIILESWSAQMVASCGGIKGVTPVFDSLCTQGVLFDNMIASAGVSDQGIVSILSGHPHTYKLYFNRQTEKSKKLSSLSKPFHDQGYTSGFYFGGQLSYGNIKSYLFNQNFDVIKEEKDFDDALPRGRLGINDGVMLQQYAMAMNLAVQPFLFSLFTISSHMPYDIPAPHKFDHLPEEGLYASSIHYSDSALGEFFKTARKMPWYKNTLFILVADHSHNSPTFQLMQSAEFNHIPCLFLGDVIKQKFKGEHIKRRVMQADIAATVLRQCKLDASEFPWSRNMLNPTTQPWAFYPLQNGGGFANGKYWVAFDSQHNSYYLSNSNDSLEIKKLRKNGEALQQVLFDEFLKF
ncbi:MAG: sulfatase-like hydrolase/transferase [Bacteroidetes bacterium]|nr:sulfatase-like hydrolase/transferase [Bacteroidota bacterium]